MKNFNLLLLAGILLSFVLSCQKDEVGSSLNDDIIDQEIEIENLLADLDAFTEDVIDSELASLKSAPLSVNDDENSCPVTTWYRNDDPRKMIIDFGDACEGRDGKLRSGKIIVTTSSFENHMATRTKTFENFSINGKAIDGVITKTITLNRDDNTRISVVNEDLTITSAEKVGFRTGTMNRIREQGDLSDRSDNRTTSWGEIVTEWQDDITVTKTISEENPLVFLNVCRQIVSGVLSVTAGDKAWSIDYGTGDCDNHATVFRNGREKIINLGRKPKN